MKVASKGVTWNRVAGIPYAAIPRRFASACGISDSPSPHSQKTRALNSPDQSPTGTVLLDVLLDHSGVPDGIDLVWQPKRYLGAPVPGATVATVNLAHVVAAVEFLAEETVEQPGDVAVLTGQDVEVGPAQDSSLSETIERANELADKTSLAGG